MRRKEEAWWCAFNKVFAYYPRRGAALLERWGSIENVFAQRSDAIDSVCGIYGSGTRLLGREMLEWAQNEAGWYEAKGVKIIDICSDSYPPLLKECVDAPPVLYFMGNADLLNPRVLGIVGTRLATEYGKQVCSSVVAAIAEGGYNPLIVSGLAIGVDVAAHIAALDNSLQSVAVLPCGIDRIYPARHREVAVRMLDCGGVLTEFPRGMTPLRHNFLQRNRIIAGMSEGILVAESRVAGGSMSTVEYANSYNREVFAAPGKMTDANSYGCNYLISKNVAQLCLNGSTIASSLGWESRRVSDVGMQPDLFSVSEDIKRELLLTLSPLVAKSFDELLAGSSLDFGDLSAALLELELEGRIIKGPDGCYKAAKL